MKNNSKWNGREFVMLCRIRINKRNISFFPRKNFFRKIASITINKFLFQHGTKRTIYGTDRREEVVILGSTHDPKLQDIKRI